GRHFQRSGEHLGEHPVAAAFGTGIVDGGVEEAGTARCGPLLQRTLYQRCSFEVLEVAANRVGVGAEQVGQLIYGDRLGHVLEDAENATSGGIGQRPVASLLQGDRMRLFHLHHFIPCSPEIMASVPSPPLRQSHTGDLTSDYPERRLRCGPTESWRTCPLRTSPKPGASTPITWV